MGWNSDSSGAQMYRNNVMVLTQLFHMCLWRSYRGVQGAVLVME